MNIFEEHAQLEVEILTKIFFPKVHKNNTMYSSPSKTIIFGVVSLSTVELA